MDFSEYFVSLTLSYRGAGRWIGGAVILLGVVLCGCATPPSDPVDRAAFERTNDPLEPLNRKTFALNQFLDEALLRPAAKAYVFVVPEDARQAVHHMLDNMKEPTLFFNHLLQGEFRRAGITAGRFVVNTTVGLAGMVDVMTLSGSRAAECRFWADAFRLGRSLGALSDPADPRTDQPARRGR
jgi:ABC-type transporter lipoprotein component MlaA